MKFFEIKSYQLDSFDILSLNELQPGTTFSMSDLPVKSDQKLLMAAFRLLHPEAYQELEHKDLFYVGQKNKIYGPSVVTLNGEIGFNIGTTFYPLEVQSNIVKTEEGVTVEWSLEEGRAYGYPAKIMKFEILKDDKLICLELVLRLQDYQDKRNIQELKTLIKGGDYSFISGPPSGNSGSGKFEKTFPSRVLEPGSYTVERVKRVTKKDGSDMYILSIDTEGSSYTPVKEDRTVDLNHLCTCPPKMQVYAPKEVSNIMSLYGDSIDTKNYDWMFTMLSKEEGKKAGTVRADYTLTTDQPYIESDDNSELEALLDL